MSHKASNRIGCIATLTVSDTRSLDEDVSGDIIVNALRDAGHSISARELIKDDFAAIQALISDWSKREDIEVIIVTGGTGPSVRDVTPDAILPLCSAVMSGFGELFRAKSYEEIGAAAMLTRAEAGWIDSGRERKPIFLLPGSPKAVQLALGEFIIPQLGHLIDLCRGQSTL